MDPYTAATIASTLGNIIGGFGRKKAAKDRHRKRVKRIKSAFSQRMEDLRRATGEVVGGIEAASRARGTRGAPDLLESETDKFQLRTFRLKEQEDAAIKEASAERRQGIKSGDFQIGMSLVKAPFSYGIAQDQAADAADRASQRMFDNTGGTYSMDAFGLDGYKDGI
tara:strand:+ start:6111 stop:6611 length:501 start_codon:yes stop_codon:yes gene_type:complete